MLDFTYLLSGQYVQRNCQRRRRFTVTLIVAVAFSFGIAPIALSQEEESIPTPTEPASAIIPTDGLYFADILVRNRPIFQIGSLPQIDASDRVEIINRRIASLLSQSENPGKVEIAPDNPRKIATLRVKNRILMTVTQQDAEDFGLSTDELATIFLGLFYLLLVRFGLTIRL